MSLDFSSVADDIEWLRDAWWQSGADPSEGEIRRGSATLDLLLNQGLLGRAWRHFAFPGGEPEIGGPDVIALAARFGLRPEMSPSLVAGGGRLNGIDASFIGVFRVDNPQTGIPADADVGFAVSTTAILRDARNPTPSDLDCMIDRQWKVSQYLSSAGAIRKGQIISRKEVIGYFRNYAGGAHSDLLKSARNSRTDRHELIHDLVGHVRADIRDGLHFELLSIGQAIGRSNDVASLLSAIRRN